MSPKEEQEQVLSSIDDLQVERALDSNLFSAWRAGISWRSPHAPPERRVDGIIPPPSTWSGEGGGITESFDTRACPETSEGTRTPALSGFSVPCCTGNASALVDRSQLAQGALIEVA